MWFLDQWSLPLFQRRKPRPRECRSDKVQRQVAQEWQGQGWDRNLLYIPLSLSAFFSKTKGLNHKPSLGTACVTERGENGKDKKIFFGKKILWGEMVGKSTAPGLVNRDDRLSFKSFPNIYSLS